MRNPNRSLHRPQNEEGRTQADPQSNPNVADLPVGLAVDSLGETTDVTEMNPIDIGRDRNQEVPGHRRPGAVEVEEAAEMKNLGGPRLDQGEVKGKRDESILHQDDARHPAGVNGLKADQEVLLEVRLQRIEP